MSIFENIFKVRTFICKLLSGSGSESKWQAGSDRHQSDKQDPGPHQCNAICSTDLKKYDARLGLPHFRSLPGNSDFFSSAESYRPSGRLRTFITVICYGTYLGSYEQPRPFNPQCLHCYKGKICDLIRYTVLLFAFGRGKIGTDTDLDFLLQPNPDQDLGFDEQR